jgi:hypothetical protein
MNSEHTGRHVVDPQWLVEEWAWNLIRVPGFGRYRKPTVGIGRLKKISDCQVFKLSDRRTAMDNGQRFAVRLYNQPNDGYMVRILMRLILWRLEIRF